MLSIFLLLQNQYQKFKEIVGAQGVKVLAKDLEKALAGMPLFAAQQPDEVEILKVGHITTLFVCSFQER